MCAGFGKELVEIEGEREGEGQRERERVRERGRERTRAQEREGEGKRKGEGERTAEADLQGRLIRPMNGWACRWAQLYQWRQAAARCE